MSTVRTLILSALTLPTLVFAQSSNTDLFSFVMPDAQLIAGAHVDSAKNSPFGQFVLQQMPIGGKYLQGFITETGIDPRADISEIIGAWNGTPNATGRWLIAARGTFGSSIETIEVNALENGAVITRLPGVDLLAVTKPGMNTQQANLCIALYTDGFTDLVGDCTTVNSALQFGSNSAGAASAIAMKARDLRAQQDLWFASVVPLSELSSFAPAGDGAPTGPLSGVFNSKLFSAIQQVSGGVRFPSAAQGSGAQLSGDIVMDTPQNATSLQNIVNFLASLIQMNGNNVPAANSIFALLANLQTSVSGNTLNIGLNVSETTLEQVFQQVSQLAQNHITQEN
ncbi:MAG TPA: hypothetical protein VKT81_02630 [Bryobacteraceae bacterium]|nr:hypothetical protein [Bryobacteraceae bacterium]